MVTAAITPWIGQFNRVAELHWNFHRVMFGSSTLVILTVALVDFLLRNQVSATKRYFVWLLVLVRLTIPISIQNRWGLPQLLGGVTTSSRLYLSEKFSSNYGGLSSVNDETAAPLLPSLPVHSPGDDTATNNRVDVLPVQSDDLVFDRRFDQLTEPAFESPESRSRGTDRPRGIAELTWKSWWMIVWTMCVVVLGMLVTHHVSLSRRIVNRSTMATRQCQSVADQCASRLRLARKCIPVRLTDDLMGPAVYGIFRPVILMPRWLVSRLTHEQQSYVYAHELRHWQRGDIYVNWWQTALQLVYFYHPLFWWANRRLRQLREEAVDEGVMVAFPGEWRAYAATLIDIVAISSGSRAPVRYFLAFSEQHSSIARRIRRLTTLPQPKQARVGVGGIMITLVVGALTLPATTVRRLVADEPKTTVAATVDIHDSTSTNDSMPASADESGEPRLVPTTFRVEVTDEEGQPLVDATVAMECEVQVSREWLDDGTWVAANNDRLVARVNSSGVIQIRLPEQLRRWRVQIESPSGCPALFAWDLDRNSTRIPPQLTVSLERASAGEGIVVAENGQPIEGAIVQTTFEYRPSFGVSPGEELYVAKTVTDRQGHWRLNSLPSIPRSVWGDTQITVAHDSYRTVAVEWRVPRAETAPKTVELAHIVLSQGSSLSGHVTDEQGQPIENARIQAWEWPDRLKSVLTNAQGEYELPNCRPGNLRVVVAAERYAMAQKMVDIQPDLGSVDFRLAEARTRRLRVVDANNRPLPDATIRISQWQTYIHNDELREFDGRTNDEGMWEWQNAPVDPIVVSISAAGRMTVYGHKLATDDKLSTVVLPNRLQISGRVTNAETNEPVTAFRVIPIARAQQEPAWGGSDLRSNAAFHADGGYYRLAADDVAFAHGVRIEAPGFAPAQVDNIASTIGSATANFALKPIPSKSIRVLAPDGTLAVNAQVAVAEKGWAVNIENGRFMPVSSRAEMHVTDHVGQFRISEGEKSRHIIVLHSTGCASRVVTGVYPNEIQLEGWGRIEGTFRRGNQLVANEHLHSTFQSGDLAEVTCTSKAYSDAQGDFVIDHLFPGTNRVGHHLGGNSRSGHCIAASSAVIPIDCAPGEVTEFDYGGNGRRLQGQLVVPHVGTEQINWSFAEIELRVHLSEPRPAEAPADVRKNIAALAAWNAKWLESDEGRRWQSANQAYDSTVRSWPRYQASADQHGRFQIDDVRPGDYRMSVHSLFDDRFRWGESNIPIRVDDALDGATDAAPVDVGEIHLRTIADLR